MRCVPYCGGVGWKCFLCVCVGVAVCWKIGKCESVDCEFGRKGGGRWDVTADGRALIKDAGAGLGGVRIGAGLGEEGVRHAGRAPSRIVQ